MQDIDEMQDNPIGQIDELIENFDVAMLVTESLEGELRARPMAIAEHGSGAVLYFLARGDDSKLKEILQRREVNVVMQDDGRYVSISGKARLETDQTMIDRHWSRSAKLWFPDGPGDPAATLVIIEPTHAEGWDRTGMQLLEFWWEAGKALLQGNQARDDELAGHTKVRL